MTTEALLEAHAPSTDDAVGYPVIGETTVGLGEYLIRERILTDAADYQRVRRDALAIVSHCRRFDEGDGTRTGLVVGYVQSGKTLSMTTVSALARDNGCRIIVLLAGVTTNLLQQNANRFKKDLRSASGRATAWRIFNSQDGLGGPDRQNLVQAVAEWRDAGFPEAERQTLLFLVLKNHAHLDKLYDLLRQVDLRGIPALILDDEADQAGLNTTPDDTEGSTTYRKIARVRAQLPHHTYLQYTATPQAPLLIALDDMLSPAFADLVEPGDKYRGGQTFFGPASPPWLVRVIPEKDLFRPGSPPDEPPESLLEAMRVFFVGCALAAVQRRPRRRSMLVHPSPRTSDHAKYLRWIQAIIDRWATAMRSSEQEERDDVLLEFRAAYDDLARSYPSIPEFATLTQRLQVSLGRVSLKEVNSQDGSEIDWENHDDHILVGGEKLNRGFTVEGLTVTYMPRDAGEWNADTIQQRARFFGYKAEYLSLCRLYLHPDVVHAYRHYVRHEDDIRKQLAEHSGRPLREWRRAFFLNAKMKPTRRNVLSDPLYRVLANEPWFVQRHPPLDEPALSRNRRAFSAFVDTRTFGRDEAYFTHTFCEVPLAEVYQSLLVEFETRGDDVPRWFGLLVTLGGVLDRHPDAPCVIVQMFGGDTRERSVAKGGINPMQGRSSSGNYPGDLQIRDAGAVTVQLHRVNIKKTGPDDVPVLAVHVPEALRADDVLVQGG